MSPAVALRFRIGGESVSVQPLPVKELWHFRRGVLTEFGALVGRTEALHLKSDERRIVEGLDEAVLLKLGLPGVITDVLLEQSTPREREQVLSALFLANGFASFVDYVGMVVMDVKELVSLRAKITGAINAMKALEEIDV